MCIAGYCLTFSFKLAVGVYTLHNDYISEFASSQTIKRLAEYILYSVNCFHVSMVTAYTFLSFINIHIFHWYNNK